MHIAVDLLGSDLGPRELTQGCLRALRRRPDLEITAYGPAELLQPLLASRAARSLGVGRLRIIDVSEQVEMDDAPSVALRRKSKSSMPLALQRLADGRAHACVSAGNTGALMAFSVQRLGMLPSLSRPAIARGFPSSGRSCQVLDLGANIDCTAARLLEFGRLGHALHRAHHPDIDPRIALLNIGSEAGKGLPVLREADRLFRASKLNYVGFVEANQLFNGSVDVAVCDGFHGNLVLKTLEGTAALAQHWLQGVAAAPLDRVGRWLTRPSLSRLQGMLDPRRHNGAQLLGLSGVVVKSHGNADRQAFAEALLVAADAALHGVPQRVAAEMSAAGAPG